MEELRAASLRVCLNEEGWALHTKLHTRTSTVAPPCRVVWRREVVYCALECNQHESIHRYCFFSDSMLCSCLSRSTSSFHSQARTMCVSAAAVALKCSYMLLMMKVWDLGLSWTYKAEVFDKENRVCMPSPACGLVQARKAFGWRFSCFSLMFQSCLSTLSHCEVFQYLTETT